MSTFSRRVHIFHARVQVYRNRAKWFEKMIAPQYCWWIAAGRVPTVAEGRERLEHYQKHGATEYAFWFGKEWPRPEAAGVK